VKLNGRLTNGENEMKKKVKQPYQIVKGQGSPDQVLLFGVIGWDVDDTNFVRDISGLGDFELIINSEGGSVTAGISIFNTIRAHPGRVTGIVNGAAFSMASYILQACDHRLVYSNSLLMIHNPFAIGLTADAEELRRYADLLDTYAAAVLNGYADGSGLDSSEIKRIMDEETFYVGQEIIDNGFADDMINGNADISGILEGMRNEFRSLIEEKVYMQRTTTPEIKGESVTLEIEGESVTPEIKGQSVTPEIKGQSVTPDVMAMNNARVADIRAAFKPFSEHNDLLIDCIADHNCSVAMAQSKLLAKIGEGSPQRAQLGTSVTVDNYGAVNSRVAMDVALCKRAGLELSDSDKPKLQGNPFLSYSLFDMARASMEYHGQSTHGLSRMQIVGSAITHTSSDYPNLLSNLANKALMAGYAEAPKRWRSLAKVGSASDYKPNTRIQLGTFNELKSLGDGGAYTYGVMPAERAETVQVGTKGLAIGYSRQMIINDDLNGLVNLASGMGRAAARQIEIDFFTLFNSNPTMGDGVALWATARGNYTTSSGTALSLTSLKVADAIFDKLTDLSGNYIALEGGLLVVPSELKLLAREILQSVTDWTGSNSRKKNVLENAYEVVDSPYLSKTSISGSATAWYLLPRVNEAPAFEVTFLDGNMEPYLETAQEFDVDGFKTKVRYDYGVGAIDYMAYKNDGA